MKSVAFDIRCPRCGGDLEHMADGRPTGWTSRSIAQCVGCGHRFVIQATIADAKEDLGYHNRRRTPHEQDCPCAPCRRARERRQRETAA